MGTEETQESVNALVTDAKNSAKKNEAQGYVKTGAKTVKKTVDSNADSAIKYLDSWIESGQKWLDDYGVTIESADQLAKDARQALKNKKKELAKTNVGSYMPDTDYWYNA